MGWARQYTHRDKSLVRSTAKTRNHQGIHSRIRHGGSCDGWRRLTGRTVTIRPSPLVGNAGAGYFGAKYDGFTFTNRKTGLFRDSLWLLINADHFRGGRQGFTTSRLDGQVVIVLAFGMGCPEGQAGHNGLTDYCAIGSFPFVPTENHIGAGRCNG